MILDIFTYFAQFPLQSGVLKMFNAGSSTHEAYATLKTAVKALPLKEAHPGHHRLRIRSKLRDSQRLCGRTR